MAKNPRHRHAEPSHPRLGWISRGRLAHPYLAGALLWTLFSVIMVFLRGVRWDENYEFAQVILGVTPYPADHPLAQYVSHFFSLQTYGLAVLMHFFTGPALPNAVRNILFLMATVLPPFLFGARLTRRPLYGHAAAVLVLMGIHVPFFSTYPVQVWPGMYSNGHIGQGLVLLALYFILAGHFRSGYLLAGLLPAIHLGQFPPLALWIGLRLLWVRRGERSGAEWRAAWRWLGAGVFLSCLFWVVQHQFALPPPVEGAYTSAISPTEVFRGYMAHHASHRSVPWGTGHMALIAFILLASAAAWREAREGEPCGFVYWLSIYGGLAATLVWGIMAVHLWLGADIPQYLIGWMPYRLINHISPLLIPLLVAMVIGERNDGTGRLLLFFALFYGLLRPAVAGILPESIYNRYVATGEAVYFALYGAAYVRLAWACRGERRFLLWWWPLLGIALSVLAYRHQFGTACVVSGAAAACILEFSAAQFTAFSTRFSGRLTAAVRHAAEAISPAHITAIAGMVLILMAAEQTCSREHLPVTPFERQVRAYLAAQGESGAMILVRHQQETLQARLQHPVMTDMATITWVPYRPALGPSLYKMYRELYGINLAPRGDEPVHERAWFEVWPAKTRDEWIRLSREYGFHYIMTPPFMQLDLPCILEDETGRLYQVSSVHSAAE